ncbi:MAG: MFS transporter [Candidatus Rokuibacteriota bacterium]
MSLAAFQVRSFRFQFSADLLTSWAVEMEVVILGWYVMVQTGSVLMLTVFGSLQFLGTLAAPMFGVLGDRLGSRFMLCVMRGTYAFLALALMTLGFAGVLAPAHVLVAAALVGIFRPNDMVMRNALIGATIPPGHLIGALGMSRATQDSARIAGALAGASLSATAGISVAYVFVSLFYLASLALTSQVSRGLAGPDPASGADHAGARLSGMPRSSSWRDLVDGLAYVWNEPRLLAAMWLAFLVNLCAYPLSGGLLPYVAKTVYGADAQGLGWLVASFSLGALAGSALMTVTGGARNPERSMVVTVLLWYALLAVFGLARSLPAGIVVLAVTGLVQSVAMISMAGSLLRASGARFRGRVMGVRTLAVYGLPLGLMASGALVDRIGYTPTVTLYAVTGILFSALIALRWRAHVWQGGAPVRPLAASPAE